MRYLAAYLLLANFLQYDIGGVLSRAAQPRHQPQPVDVKNRDRFLPDVTADLRCLAPLGMRRVVIFALSVIYNIVALQLGEVQIARQLPGQLQFFVVGMALSMYGERIRIHPLVSGVIALAFLAVWTCRFHPAFGR